VQLVAHYTKNVWTDNVTPVDKAHMDVIENGLVEAADLYYLGDWVAGTYKEGDIVVYNGVAYVAVRQTTQTPVPWAAGQAALSYGLGLPSNPVDGQEAVLVDSVTNPAYQWRFRYNAGHTGDAYKWEFIGGPPFRAGPSGTVSGPATANSWVDVTGSTTLTAPRAGMYECYTEMYGQASASFVGPFDIYLRFLGSNIGGSGSRTFVTPTAVYSGARGVDSEIFALAAGETIKVQVSANQSGTDHPWSVREATLRLLPFRVS